MNKNGPTESGFTLAMLLPKMTADQRRVYDGMSEAERAVLAHIVKWEGPDVITNPNRWDGNLREMEYARNF
jgi:hypothetical protein